jgi:hypothetical protein
MFGLRGKNNKVGLSVAEWVKKLLMIFYYLPLPWWERVRVRGKNDMSTTTLTSPIEGGGDY